MKRPLLILSFAVLAAAAHLHAQRNQLRMEKIADRLHVIFNNGGNTAVFETAGGVMLVDTKFLPDAPEILEKVKSVTDKPVRWVINTHHHGDHVGGNPGMPQMIEIVAHENAAKRMTNRAPTRVYKDHVSFFEGKDRVEVYYFGRGHTDGDSIIHFPALKVIHTGDLFSGRNAPLIDVNGGGSGVEYPKTIDGVAKRFTAGNAERVIPGHNPILAHKDLLEFQTFSREVLTLVDKAVKDGKTVEDAQAAVKAIEAKYPGYNFGRLPANAATIYNALKK